MSTSTVYSNSAIADVNRLVFRAVKPLCRLAGRDNPWAYFSVKDTGAKVSQVGVPCIVLSLEVRFPVSQTFSTRAKVELPPIADNRELSAIDRFFVEEAVLRTVRTAILEGLNFAESLYNHPEVYESAIALIESSEASKYDRYRVKQAVTRIVFGEHSLDSYISLDMDNMLVRACVENHFAKGSLIEDFPEEMSFEDRRGVWREEIKQTLLKAINARLKEKSRD